MVGSADFFAVNHYSTMLIEDRRLRQDPEWATPSWERDTATSESSDPSWKRLNFLPSSTVSSRIISLSSDAADNFSRRISTDPTAHDYRTQSAFSHYFVNIVRFGSGFALGFPKTA